MKTKLLCCFFLFLLLLSCGNSGSKPTGSKAQKITMNDTQVKSYIKVIKEFNHLAPELPEKVQAQVPIDLSPYNDIIVNNGFKNQEEFSNTSLVISICMNVILQAEHMDQIQGKTKEEYISEFTQGLDVEDEFDRLFKEKMENQLGETLSEMETEGLIGQNTNSTGTFIHLLKKKVGEKNTMLVLNNLEELKNLWVFKF
ncbi:MAG: hypothetical protein JXJ04_16730 [Spirochaetales bacterium]|nr:hypothetical protein [Spirochaetales bacterium]